MARPRALLIAALLALAGAWGMVRSPAFAVVTVKGSPHDFGVSAPLVAPGGSCTACHIPHAANDNTLLWPRWLGGLAQSSPKNYRYELRDYDGLTLGGQPSSTEKNYLGPITVQCYDCHDRHYESRPRMVIRQYTLVLNGRAVSEARIRRQITETVPGCAPKSRATASRRPSTRRRPL